MTGTRGLCTAPDCPTPPTWQARCPNCATYKGRYCTFHISRAPAWHCWNCGRGGVKKVELGA